MRSTKNNLFASSKTGGNVLKSLIAAEYTGVQVDFTEVKLGTDNKTPEFLAKNPNGLVPVLETGNGPIWESNAIARYLAREGKNNLYGKDNYEAALIEQWIEWTTNEISLPGRAWIYPIVIPTIPNNPKATARAKEDIKKALGILNDHLLHRTFLVGERVSLADIIMFSTLHGPFGLVFDTHFRKPFANVNRWFLTIANQPEVKKVVPETKLCEKMAVAPAHQPAAEAKTEKKQEKKPQEKKEEKKPAPEKKPKAPVANDDEDDDGIPRDEEPKAKNPLDLLPKSETFQMDDWKRTYSNSKDYKGFVCPWFWEHFDPKGYSIYSCVYKNDPNDELDVEYKTSNRIGGWFQRLDKVRKYAFGNVLYHKIADNKFYISGLWVFRGLELPQEMKENDDAEHYTWTKEEDLGSDDLKKRFLEYACWEGDFGGKGDALGGKTFK